MSQGKNVVALKGELRTQDQKLTRDQLELLKRTICAGATDDEFQLFTGICNRTGLDPFARQICMVKRYNSSLEREVATVQVTVDGFRLIAARTGKFAGQKPHQWCGDDGKWVDVWLDDQPPKAARVGVLHKDFAEPLYAIAKWSTYAQTYYDKASKQWVVTHMWRDKPDHMLSKCAEALALRRAFPNDLSGLYTIEETKEMGVPLVQESAADFLTGEVVEADAQSDDQTCSNAQSLDSGITDDDRQKVARLIERVKSQGTYDVAAKWAQENLTGIALQYFGQELLKAKQDAGLAE